MECRIRKRRMKDAADLAAVINNKDIQDNLRDGLPYPYTEKDAGEFISAMLAAGENQIYAFDPSEDSYADGYDWTAAYDESRAKSKIPEALFEPLMGEMLEKPGWEEGIPEEISEIMDMLCDAVEE